MSNFEYLALQLDGYDPDSLGGESLATKKLKRSNSFEMLTIVNTMDYSPDEWSVDERKSYAKKSRAIAPKYAQLNSDASDYEYYGEDIGLSWEKIAESDPNIPDPPSTPLKRENLSGKKVLVIGSIRESVTPYKFAKETAKLLKSPLISVESSVHGPAAGYDIDCLNNVLIDYFVRDIIPQDMTCKP